MNLGNLAGSSASMILGKRYRHRSVSHRIVDSFAVLELSAHGAIFVFAALGNGLA